MPDLTTVADVKAWGGVQGTAGDTVLSRLITEASAFIAKFTGRLFGATQSYTDILSGSGGSLLFLPSGPASAVSALTVDAVTIPAQSADGQAGYFLINGGEAIALSGYVFTRGARNVRVTYTAGYATAPSDIVQACIELVVAAYRRGARGPEMQSETVAATGQTFTWSVRDIPAPVLAVLRRYEKKVPA